MGVPTFHLRISDRPTDLLERKAGGKLSHEYWRSMSRQGGRDGKRGEATG